ncbi:hypothetical protein PR048_028025 [Dryococelus australis]|uniref:Uncharacterized protein n=1 Tax=Dryococelus australis TaxID=614101 RepID=A0ABQ9GI46_9NEOP|nr:hypothetical protein PR048_028025 [Dryococelus australis]
MQCPRDTALLLVSHQGELGLIPGRVTPGFSQVGIVPDNAAGRWVFSATSRFPRPSHSDAAPLSTHFTHIGSQDLESANRESPAQCQAVCHRRYGSVEPRQVACLGKARLAHSLSERRFQAAVLHCAATNAFYADCAIDKLSPPYRGQLTYIQAVPRRRQQTSPGLFYAGFTQAVQHGPHLTSGCDMYHGVLPLHVCKFISESSGGIGDRTYQLAPCEIAAATELCHLFLSTCTDTLVSTQEFSHSPAEVWRCPILLQPRITPATVAYLALESSLPFDGRNGVILGVGRIAHLQGTAPRPHRWFRQYALIAASRARALFVCSKYHYATDLSLQRNRLSEHSRYCDYARVTLPLFAAFNLHFILLSAPNTARSKALDQDAGKTGDPEKTRRPTASFCTIPTCENPVTRPGIEPAAPPHSLALLDRASLPGNNCRAVDDRPKCSLARSHRTGKMRVERAPELRKTINVSTSSLWFTPTRRAIRRNTRLPDGAEHFHGTEYLTIQQRNRCAIARKTSQPAGLPAGTLASQNKVPPKLTVLLFAEFYIRPPNSPSAWTRFSHVGIVTDDAAGRRVSSGVSRFPRPFIPALLHTDLNHPHWLSRLRCSGPTNNKICLVSISHFETKIDESEIQNRAISLMCHFYNGTKIKLNPGSELGSFDLGSGRSLSIVGIGWEPSERPGQCSACVTQAYGPRLPATRLLMRTSTIRSSCARGRNTYSSLATTVRTSSKQGCCNVESFEFYVALVRSLNTRPSSKTKIRKFLKTVLKHNKQLLIFNLNLNDLPNIDRLLQLTKTRVHKSTRHEAVTPQTFDCETCTETTTNMRTT